MIIDHPGPEQIPQLRKLWNEAFGDADAFLDTFFDTAFDPLRCRCVTENGQVAAALYWLDCTCRGQRIAYIYAVATGKAHRGKGLCRRLMADTHALFKTACYAGSVLVPGEPELFAMYEKMGYRVCASITEISCEAGETGTPLMDTGPAEYAMLRRGLLPEGGVIQEKENLVFLEKLGRFYTGKGICLWAATLDGTVTGELLGDVSKAPAIVKTLNAKRGVFRTPGRDRAFAMYRPISDAPAPSYFGFAFD